MSQQLNIKLVSVGDGGCGKNEILRNFAQLVTGQKDKFTVFDNLAVQVQINEIKINLELWDTAGAEQYNRLRPLAFPYADVFLIVFLLNQYNSYKNAIKKWYPQLKQAKFSTSVLSNTPAIFVAVQMSQQNKKQIVDKDKFRKQAKSYIQNQLHCLYLECNLKSNQGLANIFSQAICSTQKYIKRTGGNKQNKQDKKKCSIF